MNFLLNFDLKPKKKCSNSSQKIEFQVGFALKFNLSASWLWAIGTSGSSAVILLHWISQRTLLPHTGISLILSKPRISRNNIADSSSTRTTLNGRGTDPAEFRIWQCAAGSANIEWTSRHDLWKLRRDLRSGRLLKINVGPTERGRITLVDGYF